MGNFNSNYVEAQAEFKLTNQRISNECENYLDFIFETSAIIDTEIETLNRSLNYIVNNFRECEAIKRLLRQKSTFEAGIEEHCNLQKHSIRKMFHYLKEAHEVFVDTLSVIMSANYGDNPDDRSEDDLLHEMRKYCQKVIEDYETDIKLDVFFPSYILNNRVLRLRKLLFRDCEQLLQDFSILSVADRKELAIENMDEVLRNALRNSCCTQLSSSQWQATINEMIEVSDREIELLSKLPLSNFALIEQAVSDIQLHARQVIRTIQLCNTQQGPHFLSILLDNKLDNFLDTSDQNGNVLLIKDKNSLSKSHKNSKRKATEIVFENDDIDRNDNDDVSNIKTNNKSEKSSNKPSTKNQKKKK